MLILPKCEFCKKYVIKEDIEICEAFPNGIPSEVMWDPEEKECNNGIKFEEDDEIPLIKNEQRYHYAVIK